VFSAGHLAGSGDPANHAGMRTQPLPLILAGAAATTVIAFGVQLAHKPNPGMPATIAALLAVYAIGLGLGRLLFGRGN
jgi:hypothetical protein